MSQAECVYLVDFDSQERETEAIKRLFEGPFSSGLFSRLQLGLGINSFCIINTNTKAVCPAVRKPGDIDILAGHLDWDRKLYDVLVQEEAKRRRGWHSSWHEFSAQRRLAEEGGICWPPNVEYLVGVEVKCAYVTRGRKLAAHKSSKRQTQSIREQIDGLLNMGLDRVLLLDIFANPPASGSGGAAWTEAALSARASYDSMRPIAQTRLPDDSPAGHCVLPLGAVPGGDETERGAVSPVCLREPRGNPFLEVDQKVRARRTNLNERLRRRLRHVATPKCFPAVLIDNANEDGRIHYLDDIRSLAVEPIQTQ